MEFLSINSAAKLGLGENAPGPPQTFQAAKQRKSPEIRRFRNFPRWQGQKDLNPRHSVLETDALPTELYPYMFFISMLMTGGMARFSSAQWWTVRDSNPGPTGYEPAALPTALTVPALRASEKRKAATCSGGPPLAPQVGLEPTTPRLTAACSTD